MFVTNNNTSIHVYGIYDLSGGTWEMVAAYYVGGESEKLADDVGVNQYAGALYEAANGVLEKYVEVYTTNYGNSNLGDATYETSSSDASPYTNSWDGDFSRTTSLVVGHGGYYFDSSVAGVFCFSATSGYADYGNGFRAVLLVW